MSGGHFNYIQHKIDSAADAVSNYIRLCESKEQDEYEFKPEYTAETIAKFYRCEKTLRLAAAMLQRVDWLVSSDDGEDEFHRKWAEEVDGTAYPDMIAIIKRLAEVDWMSETEVSMWIRKSREILAKIA